MDPASLDFRSREEIGMNRPSPRITLTGADERTDLKKLPALAQRSEAVEIGLLFSLSPEGRNRYPSVSWLKEAAHGLGRCCAIHICGRAARREFLEGRHHWIKRAGRIQINGDVTRDTVALALGIFGHGVITQDNERTAHLRALNLPGHELLVDGSGGRGVLPAAWRRPETEKPVGFAGGLGPGNLATMLPRIAAVAEDPWWVDMETSLRDGDWFSLWHAHLAVDRFLDWNPPLSIRERAREAR
jgi:hypothetical protein